VEVIAILAAASGSQLELEWTVTESIAIAIASGADGDPLRTVWNEDEEEIAEEEEEEKETDDGEQEEGEDSWHGVGVVGIVQGWMFVASSLFLCNIIQSVMLCLHTDANASVCIPKY
jgi:hypothetical protein